ncbi:41541_t:CDS:2 [Gigaspora margarita]|uniref:41541_t:CDS:1 n=1 Tax=Gigaspora margarita TaxID=4874 RepID=A0ABN7ULX6_GIGMA|nr:41541_t:CDS:2 [Gigaspora margarita]
MPNNSESKSEYFKFIATKFCISVDPADNTGGPPTGRDVAIGYLKESLSQLENAIVKLRAVEGPWDEDWRIAGGHPTNIATNAPNANNGCFGQAIW